MTLIPPVEAVPVGRLGRVHFVGIGGVGMSGIARVMHQRGVAVSGSDAHDSPVLAALRELGLTVYVGHQPGHVGAADTVVTSTAVRQDNPELVEARRRGLRVLPRAAALAALMLGRRAIAVTGTHGKTTTTSMLTVALQRLGADPGYVIGGTLMTSGLGADDGGGEFFVVEADESDGSFLMLHPEIAVVTNVEADHLDNYGSVAAVHEMFARFVARIRPGGLLVACADDPGAAAVAERAVGRGLRVRTYGHGPGSHYRIDRVRGRGLGTEFEVSGIGPAGLAVPGGHNVGNATAALAVVAELGLDLEPAVAALAGFRGTARRFEPKGEASGVRVFDSYAHHPTEVAADLTAARQVAESGRVVVVFQPHLYSRTRIFAAEFGTALGLADVAVVLDVYGAREDPEPGVSGRLVADAVPGGEAVYVAAPERVPRVIAELARPGDVVLTMGAGDVTLLGPRILDRLRRAGEG